MNRRLDSRLNRTRHPLHILFITGEYPPMQGGVGAYTAELGAALIELGVRVSVLTSRRAAARAAQVSTEASGRELVEILPRIERWGPGLWRQAAACARQRGATWLHVQYQTAAYGMNPAINVAPWWWRRAGFLTAWTYHDLLAPYLFPKAGERLRRWITELPAQLCDLTIVTNEGDRLALANRTLRTTRPINVSPIGSNIRGRRFTDEARRALRQARGYAEHDVVVGYFGFLNRSKGGLTLVRTLHELIISGMAAHLLMIGERVGASDPTNFAYLQEVEGEIGARGLEQRVRWTGRLEDEDVSAALAVCDVLLMPYADGVSLRRGTLMAGLAHGCAIVTTMPQAPLPELVDGTHLLTVPPDDPGATANAVRRIVDDPALAARLQRAALAVSERFSWQSIAKQHLEFYARDV